MRAQLNRLRNGRGNLAPTITYTPNIKVNRTQYKNDANYFHPKKELLKTSKLS